MLCKCKIPTKNEVINEFNLFHHSNLLRHCGIDLFGGKSSTDNIDAYLIFHLKLRASNLLVAPYTEYQQFLYETISKYLEEGWNYQQIADWLNDNGYKTPRGKKFRNAHAHSIVKKKKIRELGWIELTNLNSQISHYDLLIAVELISKFV